MDSKPGSPSRPTEVNKPITRSNKGRKYYSVTRARDSSDVGIYTDWAPVNAVVTGVPNNEHQCTYGYKETVTHFIRKGIINPPVFHKGKEFSVKKFYETFVDDEVIEEEFWTEPDIDKTSVNKSELPDFDVRSKVPDSTVNHINRKLTASESLDSIEYYDSHESQESQSSQAANVPPPTTIEGPIEGKPENTKLKTTFADSGNPLLTLNNDNTENDGNQEHTSLDSQDEENGDKDKYDDDDDNKDKSHNMSNKIGELMECLNNSDSDRAKKHQEILEKVQYGVGMQENIQGNVTSKIEGIKKAIEAQKPASTQDLQKLQETVKSQNSAFEKLCKETKALYDTQLKDLQQKLIESNKQIGEQKMDELGRENMNKHIQELNGKIIEAQRELIAAEGRIRTLNINVLDLQDQLKMSRQEVMYEQSTNSDLARQIAQRDMEIERLTRALQESNTNGAKAATKTNRCPVEVRFSEGKNPTLSAFHEEPVEYGDETFHVAEAAYHYQKLLHPLLKISGTEKQRLRDSLLSAKTGSEAKEISKDIPFNKHWTHDYELTILHDIMNNKYQQSELFRKELDSTKGRKIIHPVTDSFWKTAYPRILTSIRDGKSLSEEESQNSDNQKPSDSDSDSESDLSDEDDGEDWTLVIRNKIALAGDSLLKKINTKQIHPKCGKYKCSTSNDFKRFCVQLPRNCGVECIYGHVGINDAKVEGSQSDGDFIETLKAGISIIQDKLPEASILLSALISKRGHKLFKKVKIINGKLREMCMENDVIFIDQEDILKNPKLIKKDGIHLRKPYGVKQLAMSIKSNIPRMLYPRSASVPRNRSNPANNPRNYNPKNKKKKPVKGK